MKKTSITTLIAVSILGLISCTKKGSSDIVITSQINMEHQQLNFANTKSESAPRSGKFCSSIDSISKYGAGYTLVVADSLKEKNVMIYVKGWVREQEAPLEGTIAVNVTTTKGTAVWTELKYKNSNYQPGTWVQINDSVNVSSSVLKEPFAEVGVFGFKNNGKDKFYMDDLDIKYRFYK